MPADKSKIFETRNCLSRDELVNYASGKYGGKQKNIIERHLLDCELCTDALDGMDQMEDPSKLHGYSSEILLAQKPLGVEKKKSHVRPVYLAVAAVICIFILSGIYFGLFDKPDSNITMVQPVQNENLAFEKSDVLTGQEIITDNENKNTQEGGGGPVPEKARLAETKNSAAGNKTNRREMPVAANSQSAANDKEATVIESVSSVMEQNVVRAEEITDEKEFRSAAERKTLVSDYYKPPVPKQAGAVYIDGFKISPAYVISDVGAPSNAYQYNEQAVTLSKEKREKKAAEAASPERSSNMNVNYNRQLQSVFEKIDKTLYNEALKEIENFISQNREDINGIYYRGLIYFHLEQNEKALADFETVKKKSDKTFYDDSRWYEAVIYTRKANFRDARKILKEIISEKGAYEQQAKELMQLMSDE